MEGVKRVFQPTTSRVAVVSPNPVLQKVARSTDGLTTVGSLRPGDQVAAALR